MNKIIKWSDLTKKEQSLIPNEAGSGWSEKIVPELIFANFNQHDFYYDRGGFFREKIEADVFMFAYMLCDSARQSRVVLQLWYALVSLIYFLGVSVFGVFYFRFGEYLTKEQILNNFKNQ